MISNLFIYPINYLRFFLSVLSRKKINLYQFNNFFLKSINLKNNIIFLGRARTGIYLLVKFFIKNNKKKGVLLSPFTIPDVLNMVIKAGGVPYFLDFEKKTTFLSIKVLKKAIKKNLFSVLILTHYSINEKNYAEIVRICKNKNIKVIEDSAISFVGKSRNIRINSLGDASILSFSSFKLINFFYGGAIMCKNHHCFKTISKQISTWPEMSFSHYFFKFLENIKYEILTSYFALRILRYFYFNRNKTYTNYQFGLMDSSYFTKPSKLFYFEIKKKIHKHKGYLEHRRKISLMYLKYLKNISIPYDISASMISQSSCYNYLIYVKNRDELRVKMLKENFLLGKIFYENCKNLNELKKYNGLTLNIDDLSKHLIILPTHHRISLLDAKNLSQAILKYINP